MVNIFDDTKTDDFITIVKNLIEHDQRDEALKIMRSFTDTSKLFIALQTLSDDVLGYLVTAHAAARSDRTLYNAITIANTLKIYLSRTNALILALANALSIDRALALVDVRNQNIDRARDYLHIIINTLESLTLLIEPELLITTHVQDIDNSDEKGSSNSLIEDPFRFTLTGIDTLTPYNLANLVSPYLQALFDLQHIISDLKGDVFSQPRIVSISQNSPINVDVLKIPDALDVLFRLISPAYRKQAKLRRELEIQDLEAEIALKHEQLEEKNQSIENDPEYKKARLEQILLQNEGLRLDNEKKKLDLEKLNVEIALSIIKEISPTLSETERIVYIQRLLPPVRALLESPLEPQKRKGVRKL